MDTIWAGLCRKSSVNVIDAKTMSADPVAVVELPCRVPYGFHAFFVTEVSDLVSDCLSFAIKIRSETNQSYDTTSYCSWFINMSSIIIP